MASLVHLLRGLDFASQQPHRPPGCYVVTSRPDQRLGSLHVPGSSQHMSKHELRTAHQRCNKVRSERLPGPGTRRSLDKGASLGKHGFRTKLSRSSFFRVAPAVPQPSGRPGTIRRTPVPLHRCQACIPSNTAAPPQSRWNRAHQPQTAPSKARSGQQGPKRHSAKSLSSVVHLLRGVSGVSACEASGFTRPLPHPPGPGNRDSTSEGNTVNV